MFWSSAIFTLVAIVLVFMAIKGLIRKSEYKKANLYLEYAYIGLLYLGLFLGIILYFFVDDTDQTVQKTIEELHKEHSSQFWAIEHFSVMIFALLIAQIGKLFTSKAITSLQTI
jgi:L-cystine uptake protein TcyP (sodium:dicarboxylate symporter family)